MAIVGQYFTKRRALANSLTMLGSSVTSMSFPPLFQYLMDEYGLKGALLIIGGVMLNMVVAGALIRPLEAYSDRKVENGPKKASSNRMNDSDTVLETETRKKWSAAAVRFLKTFWAQMDFKVIKIPTVALFLTSLFLVSFGVIVPPLYIVPRAKQLQIEDYTAASLLSVISIADMVSRLAVGAIPDNPRFTRFDQYGLSLCLLGISNLLSPLAKTYPALVAYAIAHGACYGAFIPTSLTCLAELVGPKRLPSAIGILMSVQGFASLSGPPFAGWLFDETKSYDATFLQAGAGFLLAGLLPFLLRLRKKRPTDTSGTLTDMPHNVKDETDILLMELTETTLPSNFLTSFKWSERSIALGVLLENYRLPQVVRVPRDHQVRVGAVQLAGDQHVLLGEARRVRRVVAQAVELRSFLPVGPKLSIPLDFRGRFLLLPLEGWQAGVRHFETVSELTASFPDKVYAKEDIHLDVFDGIVKTPDKKKVAKTFKHPIVQRGDVLTLLAVKKAYRVSKTTKKPKKGSSKAVDCLICANQKNERVALPISFPGKFVTVHNIEEIVKNYRLPVMVQLVQGQAPAVDNFTGVLTLMETGTDHSVQARLVSPEGEIDTEPFRIPVIGKKIQLKILTGETKTEDTEDGQEDEDEDDPDWEPPTDLTIMTPREVTKFLRLAEIEEEAIQRFKAAGVDGKRLVGMPRDEMTDEFELTSQQSKDVFSFILESQIATKL
uniref:CABIT domain-containing protein n=1 Tax=Branchiostoma floridae TaxID=7739 RepID=C3ZD47_BRAFL|eukprot:XP_002593547.1 hypothetical protein BRAFLDRAFT_88518 [Branchiostoma floridae]